VICGGQIVHATVFSESTLVSPVNGLTLLQCFIMFHRKKKKMGEVREPSTSHVVSKEGRFRSVLPGIRPNVGMAPRRNWNECGRNM